MTNTWQGILKQIYEPIIKEMLKPDWFTEQMITSSYVTPELVACTLGQRSRPELYYGKHRKIDESDTITFRIKRD